MDGVRGGVLINRRRLGSVWLMVVMEVVAVEGVEWVGCKKGCIFSD